MKKLLMGLASLTLMGGCETIKPIEENSLFLETFNYVKKIENKVEPFGMDYLQTPEETKTLKSGDCEDKAKLLEQMLLEDNWKNLRMVTGWLNEIGNIELHAWVEIDYFGTNYVCDPTFGNVGKKEDFCSKKMYLESKLMPGFADPRRVNGYVIGQPLCTMIRVLPDKESKKGLNSQISIISHD